jgi:hypothetical protein
LLLSWEDPHKAAPKVHRPFLDRVAPLIDEQHVALVSMVWAHEGDDAPVEDVGALFARCWRTIDYFAGLAATDPPSGWQRPPFPTSVGWAGLSDAEQDILRQASTTVQAALPGTRVVLFGSRATGLAEPDSDYDLLLIFPDDATEDERGRAFADLFMLGRNRELTFDRQPAFASEWDNPGEACTLIMLAKACGIETPLSRRTHS